MMEIDELIQRHEAETAALGKADGMDWQSAGRLRHASRQVKELIAHARYIELQRDEARACLRRACERCAGTTDPGTLEAWKRVAR